MKMFLNIKQRNSGNGEKKPPVVRKNGCKAQCTMKFPFRVLLAKTFFSSLDCLVRSLRFYLKFI